MSFDISKRRESEKSAKKASPSNVLEGEEVCCCSCESSESFAEVHDVRIPKDSFSWTTPTHSNFHQTLWEQTKDIANTHPHSKSSYCLFCIPSSTSCSILKTRKSSMSVLQFGNWTDFKDKLVCSFGRNSNSLIYQHTSWSS